MDFDPELMNENVKKLIEIVRTSGGFSSETSALEAIFERMYSGNASVTVNSDTWPRRSTHNPVDFEQIKAFIQACFSLAVFIQKKYVVGLLKSSGMVSKYNLENQLSQLEIPVHPKSSIWFSAYVENYALKLVERNEIWAGSSLSNFQYLLEVPRLHPVETPLISVSLRSLLEKSDCRAVIVSTEEAENKNIHDLLACYLLKESDPNVIPVPIRGEVLDQFDTLVQMIAVSVQEFLLLSTKELHRFSFDLGNRLAAGSAVGLVDVWNGNGESLLNRKILNSWKRVIFFSASQPDTKWPETVQVYKMDHIEVL